MKLIGKFTALTVFLWIFMSINAQTVYHDYQDGLVVFQLAQHAKIIPANEKKQVNFREIDLFKSLDGIAIQEVTRLHPTIKDENLRRVYQIKLVNPNDVDRVVRKLSARSDIRYAELKELHRTFLTPNDPRFGPAANQMWGLYRVNAQQAWDLTTGDANIVVAVTDNAINVDHPDLANKVVAGHDATTGGNDPRPCGGNDGFHGSHVSGTVGAETNNNLGVASIGWNVSIMPVKIGRCSDGALTGGYDGVIWATDNGADVINMSWGGGGAGDYGQDVCNYAWNAGVILVAAAGNSNSSQELYPAAYDNVVSVASTTTDDSRSSFSQYGTWVDIAAPGSSILSTDQNSGYQSSQGTSMASPLVAGFMGLMKSFAPNATNADLIQCLYNGADNIDAQNPNFIGRLGAGRMNAYNSLLCAQQYAVDNDAAITSILSPDEVVCGSEFTPTIVLRNFGGNTLTSVTIDYEWNGNAASLNWTGSLTAGQTEEIDLPLQVAPNGSFTFTASTSNPNNVADENPGNDQSSLDFQVDANGQQVQFTLELDCYGSDVDWEIRNDETNVVVASGGNYTDITNGQVINESYCMPSGCYTFTINDAYDDGLNGSAYNGCSIDGDYRLLDESGNTLFEMTAANGAYGAQATHNFCIIAQDNENDAGITQVVSPDGYICSTDFTPTVRLRNFGTEVLTAVTINYDINGGTNQTFDWTGSLASGQTVDVVLEQVSAASGLVTVNASTSLPNGVADDNDANDASSTTISILGDAVSLPFVEDFEEDVFGNGEWVIENSDNSVTWERHSVTGTTPGNNAAKMNFFAYGQAGARDRMISPRISLQGYVSATMSFEHAYRRFDQTAADSLIIFISSDCGESLTRVFGVAEDGTGTFATQTTNQTEFIPASADDWCFGSDIGADCFEVNLDNFVGEEIVVIFESYNGGQTGNNLFIDNINLDGVLDENLELTADFSADKTEVCEGTEIAFTDLSEEQITEWSWSFEGGTPATSTDQNPTVTYNTAGVYEVSLEVTNAEGSITETKTGYITVHTNPTTPTITQNGNTLTVDLLAGETAEWFNGNQESVGTGESLEIENSDVYVVVVTNANGCTNENEIDAEVQGELPTADFSADNEEVCAGESVSFTEITTGDVTTWSWSFEGANPATSDVENPTVTYSTPGVYEVSLEVTNAEGSVTETKTDYITVHANPSTPQITQNGNTLTVDLIAGETAEWFNGNQQSIGTGASIEIDADDVYVVVVTNANDCTSENEIQANVEVEVLPVPDFSVDQATVCAGATVSFTDLSEGGVTAWEWTFEGGVPATSIDQNPTVTYANAGSYNVTLVVTNADGSETLVESDFITVNALPNLSVSSTTMQICEGTSAVLVASGASSYEWSGNLGNGPQKEVTPIETTTYTVVGTSAQGCEKEASITITVIESPSIDVTADEDEVCAGESTTISASGADNYVWDNGLGSGASHTVSPVVNTTYTVTADNGGVCSKTESITISVSQAPELTVSASEFTICEGEATVLTANGGDNYSWSPSVDLSVDDAATVTATPAETTTFVVESENACGSDSESITITVNELPETPQIIQDGNQLSVDVDASYTVTWYYDGAVVGTGSTHQMGESGEYTVVVENDNGCSASNAGEFEPTSSIAEFEKVADVQIFPNPSTGKFTVRFSAKVEETTVYVIDAVGKRVILPIYTSEIINNNEFSIDLSHVETGVYFVTFESKSDSFTKRITVKK